MSGNCLSSKKFRLLDTFSGIGGFSLAATWVWGDHLEIAAFCEIDPYCQAILHKHWPHVPIIGDIRDVREETVLENTTGNGCEKPRPDELQNEREPVPALRNPDMVGGAEPPCTCCSEWDEDPACTCGTGISFHCYKHCTGETRDVTKETLADTASERPEHEGQMPQGSEQSGRHSVASSGWWDSEPDVCGMAYGISQRMDPYRGWWDSEWESVPRVATGVKNRVQRLRALGNAIVPAVAYEIMRCIYAIESSHKNEAD
jgi:DNA (cytosine-5)-methyltransferase 1